MGLFSKSLLFISSLIILGLGVFLLKHKNPQKNIEIYLKLVSVFCISLGIVGILFIVFL
ncbi:hypothetical protein B795N_12210 [Marinilactibacillus psychrotolerans]|nr:hypothetical protein B795N_12210 [Marinilactibacillus psychrotolerans]